MEFNIFDVLFVEFKTQNGSHIQSKRRPAICIQNDIGCHYAPTLIVLPLTHIIKKLYLPTHELIEKNDVNGLKCNSMILGEQVYTIDKTDVIAKLGRLNTKDDQDRVCRCYLANLFGEKEVRVEVS